MVWALERVTCEYFELEDRIRLTGEVTVEQSVVIWLTQRLLQRLLPLLLPLLEEQHEVSSPKTAISEVAEQRAEMLKSFTQQIARAELRPQPPVAVEVASEVWLACSVAVTATPQAVTLVFQSSEGRSASLVMTALSLRQWLGILHDMYVRAEWPQEIWPGWIKGGLPLAGAGEMLLH